MSKPDWAAGLMMPEREQLSRRVEHIKDAHQMRGMFFTSTLELVRRMRGEGAVDAVVKEAGFPDGKFGAMRKYPLRDFNTLRTVTATTLERELGSIEAGVARVASANVEIFFESVAGKTMMLLAGKDPHRLMGAAPNGYGLAVDDEGKRGYDKVGEKKGTFWFTNDALGPCHHTGTFEAAITAVCQVKPVIVVEQTALLDFKLHVTW
jgi:uncharacterized protein (TIGR02265 family)